MNALVLPSNSTKRVHEFLEAWAPTPWDRIIVVLDAPELEGPLLSSPGSTTGQIETFSWSEIDASLADPTIISREDSAIRSFGVWRAWASGAEIIFTLDDDCFPTDDDFVGLHRDNLYNTPGWQSSVPGMRVRGLPYRNLGVLRNVQVSMGLWRGSADLDAIATLAYGTQSIPADHVESRVMPTTQYFPLCGMNLAFRADVAVLMYFPLMGRGQPYRRFDDIWCGLALQRICRHLGYSIVCGKPFVDHHRASDPFVNLVKEAPGVVANEHLWEVIDAVTLTGDEPGTCMEEMGAALSDFGDEYVSRWGQAIIRWCALFEPSQQPLETAPILSN